jgi:CheY-like chemotaxis protein
VGRIVLSVEDDDNAYRMLEIAFGELNVDIELHRAADGEEALSKLRRMEPFAEAPRPDLILLNLNLPKKSGMEVLAAIRSDESLKEIPTVVFSSSALDSDRAKCLALGARDYITKPLSFDGLLQVVKKACSHARAAS